MRRARTTADTGDDDLPPYPREAAMPVSPSRQLVLDEHDARGLASTVLIAQQLLAHDDLDASQRRRIQASLERAAVALARAVVGAPVHDVEVAPA